MDVLEAIYTRRSIRKYTGQPVDDEQMQKILKAGFAAPSANNKQPWHFIIIREKDTLEKIAEKHPYAKMLVQAGCGIIVCGDTEKEDRTGYLVEDCSAAIENMLLAIHGLGLGAVWCGLYPNTERTAFISELLGLPGTVIPVGLIVVGHKAEEKEPSSRYDESRIHYERW